MSFLFQVLLCAAVFFLGRASGKLENTVSFRAQLLLLIDAIIKVDKILAFKGQSIKDLSVEELIQKVNVQLTLNKEKNES